MQELVLNAPMSGWVLPLSEVPDPVFAQGLAGRGYAIDPTEGRLMAPCDGEVVQLHRSCHALTLETAHGLQVLMHVGIDTVQMQGQGFQPRVKVGDQVRRGDLLLEFDADLLARRCRSLITVVVIPENPHLQDLSAPTGLVSGGTPWMKLQCQAVLSQDGPASEQPEQAGPWIPLPNPAGMHARPATQLVQLVKALPGPVWLESRQKRASARSLVAILGLGLGPQDELRLVHSQLQPQQLDQLYQQIASGLGDDLNASVAPPAAQQPPPSSQAPGQLKGVVASPGMAMGVVYPWKKTEFVIPPAQDLESEMVRWKKGLQQAREQIEKLARQAPPHEQGIFAAHSEILQDPDLLAETEQSIQLGQSAAAAWQTGYLNQARTLEALPNPLLAARASDLHDVGERLLGCLLGQTPRTRQFPDDCLVVAKDLTPSDTVQLDRGKVRGLILAQGGPTSHVAILARSLGLPALCAVGADCLKLAAGQQVILDTQRSLVLTQPTPEELEQARKAIQELELLRQQARQKAHQPAHCKDGTALEVAVNIGNLADLEEGLQEGGEAVGLFRTEFYFHGLQQEPDRNQQVEFYRQLAQALGKERRLVARLLDVGGDKPLPYVPMAREENPFLGIRGIRLFARHPHLFREQISALMEVADQCRLAILVPMVSTLQEWRAIRQEVTQLAQGRPVEMGVMIEVPSAALIAEQLAPEVDFFSIGTNDLTQYTLAIDRAHPDLAGQVDCLHPALLHLIGLVGQAAERHGKWVGVCGGAAQDLEAVPLLIGLGVRELSVSPPAVPAVKAEVRRWSLIECQQLAQKARACAEPQEVRALVQGHGGER